jgi:hypothetical protein
VRNLTIEQLHPWSVRHQIVARRPGAASSVQNFPKSCSHNSADFFLCAVAMGHAIFARQLRGSRILEKLLPDFIARRKIPYVASSASWWLRNTVDEIRNT